MFIGANGAGKTTTFRMLINDLKPTSGQIIINGKDIHKTVRNLSLKIILIREIFSNEILILDFVHNLIG